MGIDTVFGKAYAKSQAAAYGSLPVKGRVFVSVANRDKRAMIFPVKRLADLGFEVVATEGTAEVLRRNGVEVTVVPKYGEGAGDAAAERQGDAAAERQGDAAAERQGDVAAERPRDIVELILAGEIDLVVNTPWGNSGPRIDGYEIRTAAVARDIPCITTVQGAAACVQGIEALIRDEVGVRSLQELQAALQAGRRG